MRFASLGSGSRGNGTLVEHKDTCLLIDCGFSIKETVRRLERLGKTAEDITAVLVTHEHGDHISGVAPLARRYKLSTYMTAGTFHAKDLGELPDLTLFNCHEPFLVEDIEVQPIAVPHDAREPSQFIFSDGNKSLGLLTDLGSITPYVEQQYQQCDALLLECNHDLQMLEQGPYPESLKSRVGGDHGHLSNDQAAYLLGQINTDQLQHVVLSHLSDKNNAVSRAVYAVTQVLNCEPHWLTINDQELGFAWREIA